MDFKDKTVDELEALLIAVSTELQRRHKVDSAQEIITETIRLHQQDTGREDGAPYVPPTGYLDAYLKGAVVTRDGKEWEATRGGAIGVPGESVDWIEIVPEGVIPEWEQRQAGSEWPEDSKVRHNGHIWRNDSGTPNGHEPGVPHSGWTDLGPVHEQ